MSKATAPLTLDALAESLAAAFDDRTAKLSRALLIQTGIDAGYSLDEIAERLSTASAQRHYPAASAARVKVLAQTTSTNGGFYVSKATVAIYSKALDSLTRAGVEVSDTTYGQMFRLVSRPGSVEFREALVAKLAAMPTGKRQETLVKGVSDALAGIKASKAVKAPAPKPIGDTVITPNGSTITPVDSEHGVEDTPADRSAFTGETRPEPITSKSEKTLAGSTATNNIVSVGVSLEVALETIRRIAIQAWSPAEAEQIREAFTTAFTVVGTESALV